MDYAQGAARSCMWCYMPRKGAQSTASERIGVRPSQSFWNGGLNVVCSLDVHLLVRGPLHGDVIEVCATVNHEQGVRIREHILVDTYTIEELLQDGPSCKFSFSRRCFSCS